MRYGITFGLVALLSLSIHLDSSEVAADEGLHGNRLTYLSEPVNPYYVGSSFPKLATPQWVGDDKTRAVVVLAIDDMRDPERYEAFLRPILDRLQAVQGRAGMSIMTNQVSADAPQLKRWLDEGVSIEIHTIDHPCPLLAESDFDQAKRTYDQCVDLMHTIEGNAPVAFRMPCCDSMNSPSPRFYEAIFSDVTPAGHFLSIDSSVFNITTADDEELPAEWLTDEDGQPRFRKYVPFPSYVNTIQNYPFPYVIDGTCWQFPCIVPSDWEAQNLHQPNNPKTVEDLQVALDVVVHKQGVLNLVFHPHGWMRNDQVVQLIDYAHAKYPGQVLFLSFREALERLNQHLLQGTSLRDASGHRLGWHLLDVDHDGWLDIVRFRPGQDLLTRLWDPERQQWQDSTLALASEEIQFGVLTHTGVADAVVVEGAQVKRLMWDGMAWQSRVVTLSGEIPTAWKKKLSTPASVDAMRLRDIDGDGICELLLIDDGDSLIFRWNDHSWQTDGQHLPESLEYTAAQHAESSVRWIDLDHDGKDEFLYSDATRYGVYRLEANSWRWEPLLQGQRSDEAADTVLLPFVRPDGSNNGVWHHSESLWWQNEDTARLPDKVDRLAFSKLLGTDTESLQGEPTPADPATAPSARGFPGPTEPEQAVATMRSSARVEIELIAAEPLVMDPIAFDWAPDGKLYVVEMRDYPADEIQADQRPDPMPRGRVKVLLDDDGDGRYDRAEVFLDDLNYPTGVKVWRDGIIVSGAPDIVFAKDTNGDLHADEQRILYRGFAEGNQQHRINGLRWGLDNWLYLANGESGGEVTSFSNDTPVSIRGRDLRIDPDTGRMEAISGQTQYGRCRDDHGHWFGGSNSDPLWHYVVEDRYLRRNPHFAAPSVRRQVPAFPGPAPVFPASKTLPRFNDFDRADRFTSACSPLIVEAMDGPRFGPEGTVDTFVCEPVHNLIHRERMVADGISFRSQRLPQDADAEFLASTDNWFRPVMIRVGPDGALYVADMYRLVIEHPTWIPKHWQDQLDLRAGHDRGRIYRIGTHDLEHTTAIAWPHDRRLDQLVRRLDSPYRWQRDMAHQLLLWRGDEAAIPLLKQLVHHSRLTVARIHALYVLQALKGLNAEFLAEVIRQQEPDVVSHALVLAEPELASSSELLEAALQRVPTAEGQLAMQLACSLGAATSDSAAEALMSLATRSGADPLLQAAVISSFRTENMAAVLHDVFRQADIDATRDFSRQVILQAISMLQGTEHVSEIIEFLCGVRSARTEVWRCQVLNDVLSKALTRDEDWQQLPESTHEHLRETLQRARESVIDETAPIEVRLAALPLLRFTQQNQSETQGLLAELIEPRQPAELQAGAAEVMLEVSPVEAIQRLVSRWEQLSPRMRTRILEVTTRRKELTLALLETALKEQVDLQLDARRRQRFLDSSDQAIAEAADRLLAGEAGESKNELLAKYQPAGELQGDLEAGRKTFARVCATCHRLGEAGYAVGPDLAALSNKSVEFLLGSILDPNRAVESNYLDYVVETVDGRQFSGILQAETSTSIVLLGADGKEHRIPRQDVEVLQATGKSLMPEGLEKDLTPTQMHDLLVYLRSYRPTRKNFEGNHPQLAPRRDDGSVRLLGMHAEIYGPTLVFEPRYQNLGFWGSPEDYAIWSVELPAAGRFSVTLDYACDDSTAGNQFVLSCGDKHLVGQVDGTGTWDDYRWRGMGTIELPAGKSRIVLRADTTLQGYLMDLHQIVLEPME